MEPIYSLAKAIIGPLVALWPRVSVEGLHNIPRRGPWIIALNHISYLDPFVAAYVVDLAGRRGAWRSLSCSRTADSLDPQRGQADRSTAQQSRAVSVTKP